MKFGTKTGRLLRSLTRENLVQKMLISFGVVGVVSVYSFQEQPQSIKKGNVDFVASAKKAAETASVAPIEKPVEQKIFKKYLSFKENVEPGMTAHFEILPLPGGMNYSINFGDGSPEQKVSGLRTEHIYRRSGDFKVTLTAEFEAKKQALPPLNIFVHEAVEVAEIAPGIEM